jgi:hypothetical protein
MILAKNTRRGQEMAFWKDGDRVAYRFGDRSQASGTVVQVREETGGLVTRVGKVLRHSPRAPVRVRWDDGREREYSAFDLFERE